MASDTAQDSHRKRRSSDDELEEVSKRRKHRHHHHRHHRHHRSRKAEDEPKNEGGDIIVSSPAPVVLSGVNSRPDYDMEEGEIVEEGEGYGGIGGDEEVERKKIDSDAESGEIKLLDAGDASHDQNLGVHAGGGTSYLEARQKVGSNSSLPPGDGGRKNARETGEDRSEVDSMVYATVDNKDKIDYRVDHGGLIHEEVGTPRSSSKCYNEYGREENKLCASHSERTEEKYKTSPLHKLYNERDIYHDKMRLRSRSRSQDHVRERSQSQSRLIEVAHLKTINRHEREDTSYAENRRSVVDWDDEGKVRGKSDYRHGSRDLTRNEEREHSTSYTRYMERRGREHSLETLDRDREEREIGRDKRRENEQDRNSDRDKRREKEQDRNKDREKEQERSRDMDLRREKERQKSRDRELEMDRKRDKESYRSRDKLTGRDLQRERERDRSRDRARERDRNRERGSEKERERNRDRVRERERNGGRDRGGDDTESHRVGRHHKYEKFDVGYDDRDRYTDSRHPRHDETEYHRDRARKNSLAKDHVSKNGFLEGAEDKLKRDEDEQEDYQERVSLQLVEQEEEDLNRIKEESRRRRQAILEKYKTQQLQQQVEPSTGVGVKDKELAQQPGKVTDASNSVLEIFDGKNGGADIHVAETSFSVGKSPPQNGNLAFERTTGDRGLGEGSPKSEGPDDMFCDDIFGESPAGVRKLGKGNGLPIERSALHDNWDDADGYYSYRFGEKLDGRYEVTAAHGKGVFSTVVRAKDLRPGKDDPEEVAIKIIRNNETMFKAGQSELVILKKLVGADPEDKRHCVRFLSSFKYRNHLCLVFESLHMNLREVLKKFGRNIGLKLTAVRAYAKQLFIALKHLRNCGVLHCDIKPDNMLVNEAKNVLKLCDFGNAMFAGKNELTPYLVSRFYRAPEIILGLPYDHPMDIWSVGCCLYELYTGKVLFPGATNNDMLRMHMELKGPFPKKMLRKGAFIDQHFDQDLNFLATEEDPVTKKAIKRMIVNIKPKDIGTMVTSSPGEEPKMLANFKDLLEKIFVLDPEKRMTVSQALTHPFITGK